LAGASGVHFIGCADITNYGHLKFWAERGLIRIEDTRDGGYQIITVRTFLHRLQALNDMLGNGRADVEGFADRNMVQELRRVIDEGVALCQKAQEQGMPSDPSACRDLRRRQPKTVCIPKDLPTF
jgi:hypothetical protein